MLDTILKLSDDIWEYAEVGFDTPKSCDAFEKVAKDFGFEITRPLAGLEHALMGQIGDKGPVIAFLAEYDALDQMNQVAGAFERVAESPYLPGHGCGHNLLGSGSLYAAMKLVERVQEENLDCIVRIYGCPAEEAGSAKTILADAHVFDDVDICLSWHPHFETGLWSDRSLGTAGGVFTFKGKSAHAAAAPHEGRSALDACELMNIGTNYLREHIIDDARMHYAYMNAGGTSANVVQQEAALYYLVRSFNDVETDDIFNRVYDIAKGAALMTGTSFTFQKEEPCRSLYPNSVLSELAYDVLKDYGPLTYSELAFEGAKGLSKDEENPINLELNPYSIDRKSYVSTDVGSVSQVVPTVQLFVACEPFKTDFHSWQWVSNGKSALAHEGIEHAATLLSEVAYRCVLRPDLIAMSKIELDNRIKKG